MTYEEIALLEKVAKHSNDDKRIQLIELYCTDYTKICANNAIASIHLQFLKLLWTNLKKYLPKLSKAESVLQAAKTFKEHPNKSLFRTFMTVLKQESESLGESLKTLSHLVNAVFVEISKHMVPLLKQSFGRYANTSCMTGLISGYVDTPSSKSYSDMIDKIESFGQSHNEIMLAKELLLGIFTHYTNNDIYKFKDIENRCGNVAKITGTTDEFIFIQKLLSANEGNVQAMLEVGEKYESGNGVERNENQAEKWYTKALIGGHPNAQFFISNLITKRNQKVIEEYKNQLLEQEKILDNLKRELRAEQEKTRRLEQESIAEIKRHNLEVDNLKRQLAASEKTRLTVISNTPYEEDEVQVIFYYKLHSWSGDIIQGDNISKMAVSTYNNLIAGGKQAIINFVTGLKGYMMDGEYIIDASMSKL